MKPPITGEAFHFTPTNDPRPHELTLNCWCEPEPDLFDDKVIVKHKASDGRVFDEILDLFKETENVNNPSSN